MEVSLKHIEDRDPDWLEKGPHLRFEITCMFNRNEIHDLYTARGMLLTDMNNAIAGHIKYILNKSIKDPEVSRNTFRITGNNSE